MFDFICKSCGKLQKPKFEGKNMNTYDTKCSECGGELEIKLRKGNKKC